jgi:hypothetical protein
VGFREYREYLGGTGERRLEAAEMQLVQYVATVYPLRQVKDRQSQVTTGNEEVRKTHERKKIDWIIYKGCH